VFLVGPYHHLLPKTASRFYVSSLAILPEKSNIPKEYGPQSQFPVAILDILDLGLYFFDEGLPSLGGYSNLPSIEIFLEPQEHQEPK
jgi:hypothetical protein